jgi:hypothetical protein
MLVLTPTMLGSLLAGIALWLMFWYGVNHVDSIPYLNEYLSRKMVLDWIRKNPQTALLIGEGVNLLLHGIGSARAVFFNLGGTLVNIAVIYGFVPTRSFLFNAIEKIKAARNAA